jgi:hypothetical protein
MEEPDDPFLFLLSRQGLVMPGCAEALQVREGKLVNVHDGMVAAERAQLLVENVVEFVEGGIGRFCRRLSSRYSSMAWAVVVLSSSSPSTTAGLPSAMSLAFCSALAQERVLADTRLRSRPT